MQKIKIAANKPVAVTLQAGEEHYWCACGHSKNQPFCDGSHQGTGFKPLRFTADETAEAYLCMCKHTKDPPYCDGSHQQLPVASQSAGAEHLSSLSGPEEPTLQRVHDLAKNGLEQTGPHGEMVAMGVPRASLPQWDDIQILTAQLATRPLLDDQAVGTELIIGPNAKKPLTLKIPLFVSDMSFGSLSKEAKLALARGAEMAGTGICSGEGGMLPAEQQANRRYFYELAAAQFGFDEQLLSRVQAFHFKAGQAAKTGVGGHLPAAKVTDEIAALRHLSAGQDAISPAAFADLKTPRDFRQFSDRVREISGGIPIGMKLSANHIEQDIDFALQTGVDYIILDGRGGGTGAAPRLLRDHISVPTIAALARARKHLDASNRPDTTLLITGGLRLPEDFIKAMALGADGIAIANSAIQAIGCVAARICQSNQCPSGVATQNPALRARLDVADSAQRLARFFSASTTLMQVMARACGHDDLNQFNGGDLSTCKQDMAQLSGIAFAGVAGIDSKAI